MATLLGGPPADKWEKVVREELRKQFPEDCLVLSNVAWSTAAYATDFRYVRDGEADIVVLIPGLGMAVLEVKGSPEFRVTEEGTWQRFDGYTGAWVTMAESPARQAHRNLHELASMAVRSSGWAKFPGLFAYVVVYPQGKVVGELPSTFDRTTLATAKDLQGLAAVVRKSLQVRGDARIGGDFTSAVAKQVADVFLNRKHRIARVDTAVAVKDDLERIELLTRQQFAALRGVFAHDRVAVIGPAGSGKTMLAIWRLAALIEEGQAALYLCYNKALAEELRRRHPLLADHIKSVDAYFLGFAKEASGTGSKVGGTEAERSLFFREELPALVMATVSSWPADSKLDAVIVDEGQDFSESQVIAVLEFLKPTGTYLFLADWRQQVYKRSSGAAIGVDVVFQLHHNCRNAIRINERTNKLVNESIESMPGMPAGESPLVEHCSNRQLMAQRAWEIARQWRAHSGAVAVLSPFMLEKSAMHGVPKGHGLRLVTTLGEWGAQDAVYFSTIKAFKGIEATCVIVVDVAAPGSSPAIQEDDLYVACTRATARLALLTSDAAIVPWLKGTDAPL
ncbi:MAG: NERD domain-containing protein [Gemmatimonadales bacterium]|nr:NERD domain-containing protein [Gemmatimonadales bacterium]